MPLRIVEALVLVPLAGVDRARVAESHRDHDIDGTHDLVRQFGNAQAWSTPNSAIELDD